MAFMTQFTEGRSFKLFSLFFSNGLTALKRGNIPKFVLHRMMTIKGIPALVLKPRPNQIYTTKIKTLAHFGSRIANKLLK